MKTLVKNKLAGLSLIGGLWLLSLSIQAGATVEKLAPLNCATNCSTANCTELASSGNPATTRIFLLAVIVVMLAVFLYRKYQRKLYLAGGATLAIMLFSLLFVSPLSGKDPVQNCAIKISPEIGKIKDTISLAEFKSPTDEFEALTPTDFPPAKETLSENSAASKDEFTSSTDEFVPISDEFAPMDSTSGLSEFDQQGGDPGAEKKSDYRLLYQLAVLFSLLILISYLIKYESFRKTKGLFLMASVVYLGFFKGACPCMILSLHNTILAIFGHPVEWISLVWFVGLIPLTYFFGKVWCGWLCHLGGLQEFLFQSAKLDILKSRKTQVILRYIRIGILVILIIQLFITRTNIFIHYDPFKVAFNLFSANTTGYVLLVLLLISSVLIYRPFCRAVCPVGLILGWVALIPGARQLSKNDSCIDCVSCSKSCHSRAMTYENKQSVLNVQDCILCGDCMGSCKKHSLYVVNHKK
jgi:Pyruvate/2-oxoacid:ferredoxin oxidoreductase delta subunit